MLSKNSSSHIVFLWVRRDKKVQGTQFHFLSLAPFSVPGLKSESLLGLSVDRGGALRSVGAGVFASAAVATSPATKER